MNKRVKKDTLTDGLEALLIIFDHWFMNEEPTLSTSLIIFS